MVKDRLLELHERREKLIQDDGRAKDSPQNSRVAPPSNKGIQIFLNEVREVDQTLNKLQASVDELRKVQKDILSSASFERDKSINLERLGVDIRNESTKIRQHLMEMKSKTESESKSSDSMMSASVTERVMATQLDRLSYQLIGIMNECRSVQADYNDRSRARLKRQLSITGQTKTEQEVSEMLERDQPAVFTQNIIYQMEDARNMLKNVEDREHEILGLEKKVQEVNGLFRDLNQLVVEQGELVTQIEANANFAASSAEKGTAELSQAESNKRKHRKRTIIIIVVFIVALALVAGIIAAVEATG